jgi:heme/copper-type cytochrome/quinol oxidase subunit 2
MKIPAWLYLVAGVVVLGVLFRLFKPQPEPPPAPAPAAAAAPAAAPAAPAPKVFALVVREGKLVSGPSVIAVSEGDEVRIRITADRADEVHVHGYDLHAHLTPGAQAELAFKATRTGRFEFELHKANLELGALEVRPR